MLQTLLGTLVNVGTIVLGTTVGLLLKKGIPEKVSAAIMTALGLCTILIGITGVIKDADIILIILSMVIGTGVGTAIGLDKLLNKFGNLVEKKTTSIGAKLSKKPQGTLENGETKKSTVGEAFVTSSLLFCVGAMTVVGSLNAGLTGDNSTLFAKSVLDLISSMIFASTLGYGVYFSVVVVLVLQGGISLLANVISPWLTTPTITQMTCVGSLIIIALGLNMIKVTKIKVMDMVPAIFLPVLLVPAKDWIIQLVSKIS